MVRPRKVPAAKTPRPGVAVVPPPHECAPAVHFPLDLPQEFLDWLGHRFRLSPRQLDLIRCRAAQMVHKEAAVQLGLRVATVHRLQANTLLKLGLCGGKEGLLRWLAGEFATWELSALD